VPGANAVHRRALPVTNPADRRQVVGEWQPPMRAIVEKALPMPWPRNRPGTARRPPAAPRSLNTPPNCWKQRMPEYIALCVKEAGKTLPDGVAEVREAVDFLRYYAAQARAQFGAPERAARPDRRIQRAAAARPRRVRLHQPVELPAGDLPGQVAPRWPPATA
jgi:RHH-type proline utilization regulon transcriptional repressor/proline dehydrogenase/delta 1-pyrroline-5-carboxylate dehydrogenase